MFKKFTNFFTIQKINFCLSVVGISLQLFLLNPSQKKIMTKLDLLDKKINKIDELNKKNKTNK